MSVVKFSASFPGHEEFVERNEGSMSRFTLEVAVSSVAAVPQSVVGGVQLDAQVRLLPLLLPLQAPDEAESPGADPPRRQQDPDPVPQLQVQSGVRHEHAVRATARPPRLHTGDRGPGGVRSGAPQ